MDIPLKPAFLASLVFAATLSGCQTSSPPPKPETSAPTPSPAAEKSIGSVRVKAATLNVRQGPSAGDSVLATARRGQKLELLGSDQAWSRVRLADDDRLAVVEPDCTEGFTTRHSVIRFVTNRECRGAV